MGDISLSEGIKIIEKAQEVEEGKRNILEFLPEVYEGYDIFTVTNFLLQLSFNDKHYYSYIKDSLEGIEVLKPFELSVETRGIKLKHKKAHNFIYLNSNTILKISYGDRTYDSSYLENQVSHYNQAKNTSNNVEIQENTYYKKIMEAIVYYVENPSLKARYSLFKVSITKDEKSMRNYWVAVLNMFTSERVLKIIYNKYNKEQKDEKERKERELERKQLYLKWIEEEFPTVVKDTENVIEYLKNLGYTYRKDI